MTGLPAGTVTLLYSDIEGSTRLLIQLGMAYPAVLEEHRRRVRQAVVDAGGCLIDTQGDACSAAFERAGEAILAAAEIQRALAAHPWPADATVRVRIGIHTGEPLLVADRYTGLDVHRVARLCAAGHGGQILLSGTTADLVSTDLPAGLSLVVLGAYRFRDFTFAERVCQLSVAGLPSDFPPPRTVDSTTGLPGWQRSLVGRDAELNGGRRLLLDPATRLLTLTGPGGCGKTRLAVAIAAGLDDAFEDGVCFVPLASVTDPSQVAASLAQTLGLRDLGQRPFGELVADAPGGRELLVVLDNFEQVMDAAPLVADVLAACPRVKVLVTSREVLHLTGERELSVPPLDTPPPAVRTAGQLSGYASVRLFVERAREAKHDFVLTDADAPVVAEICRRLEGLPLSIELAAARIRYLTPAALLTRLDRRLALLTGGPRDLPLRHQTLRATIAWSHDLLNARDRVLFRRSSVFVGGWTLEAAAAVCGFDLDQFELVDALTSLIDKNLLRRDETPSGDARFSMLETIRELAAEELATAGEVDTTARRHADHFLALAEEAEPRLVFGADQVEWLQRLDEETGNMQAVFEWCRAAPADLDRASVGLRLVAALWRYWAVRSSAAEARARIETILRLASAAPPSPSRQKALQGAGILAREVSDYAAADQLLRESLSVARALGDPRPVGDVSNSLGWLACLQGDGPAARALLEASLTIFRQLDDRPWQSIVLSRLGYVAFLEGDLTRSREIGEEAVARARQTDDLHILGDALSRLGVAYHYGDDLERARALYEEALPLLQRLGDRQTAAIVQNLLGHLAVRQGAYDEARDVLRDALRMSRDVGNVRRLSFTLSAVATLAAALTEDERAVRLDAAAQAAAEAAQAVLAAPARAAWDAEIDVARRRLGQVVAADVRAAGRGLALDRAVDEALSWLDRVDLGDRGAPGVVGQESVSAAVG